MSINAISWAMNQDVFPSTAKFVLVCLCDNVGMDEVVFPSLETLCKKTSQDRKTVIACLDRLCSLGLLQEVGVKAGGVKKYRVIGLPSNRSHYVYRLTHKESGEFYIGVRSCDSTPMFDDYFGSGRWPQEVEKRLLSKEIIGIYATREEAELAEIYFINVNRDSDLIKNRFLPRKWQVPNTEPVPLSTPVPKTEPLQFQERNEGSTKNGTQNRKGTINKPSLGNQSEKIVSIKTNQKKKATSVPKDFEVTGEMFDWAVAEGVNETRVRPETEQFIDRNKAQGSTYIDWNAAWRTWMRNAVKFARTV